MCTCVCFILSECVMRGEDAAAVVTELLNFPESRAVCGGEGGGSGTVQTEFTAQYKTHAHTL